MSECHWEPNYCSFPGCLGGQHFCDGCGW
jgi:hypothetical protein